MKRPQPLTAAGAVAKSRAKTGAKPVAVTLKPEEIALLDRLAGEYGGRKAAVVAGLKALRGDALTNEELAAEMLRRLRRS